MNKIIAILLVFVSCLAFGQGATPNLRNPKAYYRFERTTGSVIEEKQDFDGTNNGASRGVTGKVGNAFSFVTNDYINLNSTTIGLGTANPVTVSCWINPDGQGSVPGGLITSYDRTNVIGWHIEMNTSEEIHAINISTSSIRRDRFSSALSTGSWHHLVAIIYPDGTFPDIYIDGALDNQGTNTSGTPSQLYFGGSNIMIGRSESTFSSPDRYFDGDIDEMLVYSRDLGALEVKQLYASDTGLLFVYENFINGKITFPEYLAYYLEYLKYNPS